MDLKTDLELRWRPTAEQVNIAGAMLAAAGDQYRYVYVGLALINKNRSVWTDDVEVEAAPGFWLCDNTSHAPGFAADDAGYAQLGNRKGTSSYVAIRRSGDWAVWEGIHKNHETVAA